MLTGSGPRVVEFNCRFGDPETQVVVPLLNAPLLDALVAVAEKRALTGIPLQWSPGAAVTTVLASGGYPGSYAKGVPIHIPPNLSDDPSVMLFHAGTRLSGDRLVTSGGRVLAATGLGSSVEEAAAKSLRAASAIEFEGRQLRRDIGWREIQRSTVAPNSPAQPRDGA
jgi:phosphoribosylamine--glycine ligase